LAPLRRQLRRLLLLQLRHRLQPEGAITVKAPMPGKISAVKAESGASVKRGDVLVVLEAMKMQNDITATADGTLHEIRVQVGDNVKTGDILAVITQ